MNIVNERVAETLAREGGITTKTLAMGYGFIIVKDDLAKKSNWPESDDENLIFNIKNILADYPNYSSFFKHFGIDLHTKITHELDVGQIAKNFQRIFDAKLSFYKNDRPENTEGYCIRTEQDCLVAVTATEYDDGCRYAQLATVIHEYGHYVEQRIIPEDVFSPGQPYCDRDTSFASALRLISELNLSVEINIQRYIADELVAWVNAIWISWIVGLDPRAAVLGAAIDSTHPITFLHPEVVNKSFKSLAAVICSKKHANDHFRQFGPYDLFAISKYRRSDKGDKNLCLQIDQATKCAFEMIRAGKKF